MGIYLNPKNALMKKLLNSKIYVDKSLLLKELNALVDTGNCFVCVSRPRRFGKTMASAMIAAYYSKGCDSEEMFAPLKISKDESFKKYLNKYNVIQFDINSFYNAIRDRDNLINYITDTINKEMAEAFPTAEIDVKNDTLANSILKAWAATGETFIILMDEYDVLVLLMDFEGIKGDVITMIGGGKVHVNVFKYMNTFTDFYSKDDVFTYLIHLGYLSYNEDTEECFISNKEIRAEWINSIEDESDYKEIIEMVNGSRELLERTLQGDEEYVAAALDKAHMRSTNPLTYNN